MIKYSLDEEYFKDINTSKKAFWLGFICADGSIKKNRNVYCFCITQMDDILLKQFIKDVNFGGDIKLVTHLKGRYSDKPFYSVTIYRETFANNLIQAGKTIYKKDLKEIPKTIPDEFKIDFIRGYFEGDGCISFDHSNNNWHCAFSGIYELLIDFQKYINKQCNKKGSIGKDKSIYRLLYGGNTQSKVLMNMMYYNNSTYGLKINKYLKGVV